MTPLTRPSDLKSRTKQFALRVIQLYSALPNSTPAQVIGRQLLRSGTSVGAQYREAIRSRSDAEYISKVIVALQELEETVYWFELLIEARTVGKSRLADLLCEADELTAILVSCFKKSRSRQPNMKSRPPKG